MVHRWKSTYLQGLACDPILAKAKLIAEAWDAGGLYQVGSFPSWSRWAEWNGRYRDDMRRFLKGDGGMAGTAITRITGSRDLYDPAHRGISASVNFLTCHDGFTLYDLYSYNMKHNEKTAGEIRMVITMETVGTVGQKAQQMIRKSRACAAAW